jgi:hypothetical protein
VEAAVEAISSLEDEVAPDAVAVVDRVIPTLNHSVITSVQHLVRDRETLMPKKDVMLHLKGRLHEETLILHR